MARLLQGIPLGEVSTSMTINAPAALLLLCYELVAADQGVPGEALRGTVQNDVLKEYVARGNYIFPPRPSMRLTTDLFAYCAERIPHWNTISISGYHIREAGSTAAQELAFTLANGIAYCEAAVAAGLSPDDFGARLSFFFNAHNDVLQEVAKFRAARRLWARIMRDRFGATSPKAQALRFHAQTGGSTLTAQQPENNLVRVAAQALSAIFGGAQSIHTNGFDEALALPTEQGRDARAPHAAGAHARGGDDRHGRPARRLVVRRVAHRRARGARHGADRADRRAGRGGGGDRGRLGAGADRGLGVPLAAGGRERRARDRRRQPVHDRRARPRRAAPARSGDRARPAGPDRGAARVARLGRGRGRRRRGAAGRRLGGEPPPVAARGARPPARRSASSAARCASSGARTTRG